MVCCRKGNDSQIYPSPEACRGAPAKARIPMKHVQRNLFLSATVACMSLALSSSALAQAAPPAAPAAAASSFRAEALRLIEDAETKLARLAEAIPVEKYTWRPGEGVRSVSEVFLHLAGGNFSIPRRLGTPPPEGFNPQGFDKSTTDKAKVVQILKDSFEHVRKAVNNLADADAEKTSPWLGGRQATYREIVFFLASHEHEHLGQSIAYARMNGIVPPWTEEQQQLQRQQQAPKSPQ